MVKSSFVWFVVKLAKFPKLDSITIGRITELFVRHPFPFFMFHVYYNTDSLCVIKQISTKNTRDNIQMSVILFFGKFKTINSTRDRSTTSGEKWKTLTRKTLKMKTTKNDETKIFKQIAELDCYS